MDLYQQSSQKQKLLILQKILLTETDENHPLSVNDLIQKLKLYDIKAERKTIYDDIATLASVGMDIVVDKRGHSNVYYVGSRLFQDEELLVLADAVASSKFLTVKKSNELIKKLQSLTSKHNATNLRRSIYVGNRVIQSTRFTKLYIKTATSALNILNMIPIRRSTIAMTASYIPFRLII